MRYSVMILALMETVCLSALFLAVCFYGVQCIDDRFERCPTLAAQVGDSDSLNISEFRAYINTTDIPGSTQGSQVDLISAGEVSTLFSSASSVRAMSLTNPELILPGNFSPLPIHMQLTSLAQQKVYYLFNVWSVNSTKTPPGCPTKEGYLNPGDDFVNDVYLSCGDNEREVIMQGCMTLGTAPFDTLNGTYTTLEFYILRNCEGSTSSSVCNVTAQDEFIPGELCLTQNQTLELVINPVGSWGLLLTILTEEAMRGYCVIDSAVSENAGLTVILTDPMLAPRFPIAEQFSELDMYVGLIPGTKALSFSITFTSTNTVVLGAPSVLPKTQGIVYQDTNVSLQLPCLQPGFVEVLGDINMSSVKNSTLYFQSYSFSIYRNCTPDETNSTKSDPLNEDKIPVILAGLIPGLTLIVTITIIVIVVIILMTRRIAMKEKVTIRQMEDMDCLSGNKAYTMKQIHSPFESLKEYDIEYNYPSLEVVGEIGEGAFGRVFKARAPGLERQGITPEFVAVKTLKDDNMSESFCKEVKAVAAFNHPNIVHLLAICTTGTHKCMIFEYMDLGGLDDLLRKSDLDNATIDQKEREESVLVTSSNFLHCSLQVARGVAYLAEQKYVHRDIASRNCLVDHNLVVKIGDFGLSRELSAMDYYRVGSTQAYLPVRWMPPEALLFGKFTTQSDVWSFGIVMWEIYTFGHQPYTGHSNHEVIDGIKASKILECPKLCPASVYDIMKICWTRSPVKRPNMDIIVARLERLQPKENGQENKRTVEATDGCVCYVNMEYGANVEKEELEECVRVEQELNKSIVLTNDQSASDDINSAIDESTVVPTTARETEVTTCTPVDNVKNMDNANKDPPLMKDDETLEGIVVTADDCLDEQSMVKINIHATEEEETDRSLSEAIIPEYHPVTTNDNDEKNDENKT